MPTLAEAEPFAHGHKEINAFGVSQDVHSVSPNTCTTASRQQISKDDQPQTATLTNYVQEISNRLVHSKQGWKAEM